MLEGSARRRKRQRSSTHPLPPPESRSTVCTSREDPLFVPPTQRRGDARSLRRSRGALPIRTGPSAREIDGVKAAPSGLPAISPTAWGRMSERPACTFTQIVVTSNTSNPGPTLRSRR